MIRPETQAYNLRVWEKRVKECRSSGKNVRTWCRENGIDYNTYFRWENRVIAANKTENSPAFGFIDGEKQKPEENPQPDTGYAPAEAFADVAGKTVSFCVNGTVFTVSENVSAGFLTRLLEAASRADKHEKGR